MSITYLGYARNFHFWEDTHMANGDKVLGQFTQSFVEEKKASGRRL